MGEKHLKLKRIIFRMTGLPDKSIKPVFQNIYRAIRLWSLPQATLHDWIAKQCACVATREPALRSPQSEFSTGHLDAR